VRYRYDSAVETRLQRVLQNRWFAAIATLAIGYIAVRTLLFLADDANYVYHVYPQEKGAEYDYPELRYTFGQIAIFLWSVVGLCTAVLTARSALFRTQQKWAARSVIAFALVFVLLVFGFMVGMAMRDFSL
jgi:hypothetical protein